jgi:HAD superfamily hydrolase (TIGR01509 family)
VTDGVTAVLFDMDGTLVDSEKVWEIALHELAARYGGRLSREARLAMVGTSSEQTMEILFADLGLPPQDPVDGATWLDLRMLELLADGVEWLPGAQALLAAVRAAGWPTALVTNTRRALVEVAMVTLGAHNFDAIVCGDDVARTKPDPGHYRAAVEVLGVDPLSCVVIEDSPAGIASAVGAGCAVIAVPREVAIADPMGAHLVSSLLEVDLALVMAMRGRAATLPRIDGYPYS